MSLEGRAGWFFGPFGPRKQNVPGGRFALGGSRGVRWGVGGGGLGGSRGGSWGEACQHVEVEAPEVRRGPPGEFISRGVKIIKNLRFLRGSRLKSSTVAQILTILCLDCVETAGE